MFRILKSIWKLIYLNLSLYTKKDKNIDLATVYRTLELLESIDIVEHLHQAHGSGIYYLKSENDNNHIICDLCKSIFDLAKETKEKINKVLVKDSNFNVINHHFIYSGVCKNCK